MTTYSHFTKAALGTAVLLASGCALPGMPVQKAIGWSSEAGAGASGPFIGAPRITHVEHKDKMAHVEAQISVQEVGETPAERQLLALPGLFTTTWQSAVLSLVNAAVLTQPYYSPAITGFTTSDAGVTYNATVTIPPLRPDNNYTASVYLNNTNAAAGTQLATLRYAGSAVNSGVSLKSGPNNLVFTVLVNSKESTYDVKTGTSTANNITTGNHIVIGDTVTFNTGMLAAASIPGISKLNVYFSSTGSYTGTTTGSTTGRVFLKQFLAASSLTWDTFVWNTTAASAAVPADVTAMYPTTAAFAPGTFSAASGTVAATAGQIDLEAIDTNGILVGKASFSASIYGTPTVSITVQ